MSTGLHMKGVERQVLAATFDRVARSVKHFLAVVDELYDLGIESVSAWENIDTSGAMGRMFAVMVSSIAELDRSLIAERIKARMRPCRLEGYRLGRTPLGATVEIHSLRLAVHWGTPNMGGPLVTAGGLVFIAAAWDRDFRAFDVETGKELWNFRLPASANATPMTYRLRPDGRQFVVIAAGGHCKLGSKLGDAVIAFTLP